MGYKKKPFLPATSEMKTQRLLLGSNTMGCVQKHMYEPSVFKHCPPAHTDSSRHSLMSTGKKSNQRNLMDLILHVSCTSSPYIALDQCIHTNTRTHTHTNYSAINTSCAENPLLPTNLTPTSSQMLAPTKTVFAASTHQ